MAATNRRQLLTGAAAYAAGAGIVAGGAALASEAKGATIDKGAWNTAMRRHVQAERQLAAYEQIDSGDADDRWEKLANEAGERTDALLQMPSPDADALAWKIHHLFDPERGDFAGAFLFSHIKQTLADAVRLAGGIPTGTLA